MSDVNPGRALFQRYHELLLEQFLEMERKKVPPDEIDRKLTATAEEIAREHDTSALIAGRSQLSESDRRDFLANVRGLMGGGSLTPLLDRPDVENIHILGHDRVVLSLANGQRIPAPPVANSDEELVMMIRHLAATAGHTSRRFDTASPILDLRLASGHRLFAVTAVAERTSVVIRRHRMLQASLDGLEKTGTITPQISTVLKAAVHPPNPANLLVVGGTGAGKTTLLRSLLSEVPQSELLVTIEDTLELHLRSSGLHERTLALETRTSNTEGTGEISMYDLAKAALRMSPDRVIVGEVRGGEVMQLLQAMGIGNDGSLGTIHAGSTRAAINKMLIYAQRSPDAPTPDSVLREIAEVLHLLVYIKKLPDGRRAITSIREVTGYEEGRVLTEEIFAPGPDGVGVYVKPFKPDGETLARLVVSGFDPESLGEPYQPKASTPRPQQAPPQQPQAPPQQAPSQKPQARPQQAPSQKPQARPQQAPAAPRPYQQPPAAQPARAPRPRQQPQGIPARPPAPAPAPRRPVPVAQAQQQQAPAQPQPARAQQHQQQAPGQPQPARAQQYQQQAPGQPQPAQAQAHQQQAPGQPQPAQAHRQPAPGQPPQPTAQAVPTQSRPTAGPRAEQRPAPGGPEHAR